MILGFILRLKFVFSFVSFLAALMSAQAHSGECHIQLKMGLLIAPDHIRVMEMGRTQVQINNDRDIFIRGEQVQLTPEQTKLVREFSLGLRKELPEIVAIAMDSMEIGFGALDNIIKGFAGNDTVKGIEEHFSELKGGLIGRFARNGDNFYIAPQGLNELDDFFQEELTSEVRQVVTNALRIMLDAMGEAYTRSESVIEGKKIDLGERVELISAEVDRSLQYNAQRIAEKADAFCQRFESLDKTESKLQKQIPHLNKYDILANQLTEAN